MDRKLIDYLPPVVRAMRELRAVTNGQQEGISELWDAVDAALNDQFLEDMTTNGLARWEKILNIAPRGTETPNARRFRIKTRINERLPFTLPALRRQLSILCGPDGYAAEIKKGSYLLCVRVAIAAKSSLEDVQSLLDRVVPAEIVIDLSLKYNTHGALAGLTHGRLSGYTHEQLRSEVPSEWR